MRTYYIIHDRNRKYHEVRAYSLRDVRAYAERAMGISKPIIEDNYRDVLGKRNSGLAELPPDFAGVRE